MFSKDSITNYRCPRWDDLPDVPLYMDQVIMVITNALSLFAVDGEAVITSAMINNYVKQKLIKPPKKKKYMKEHIASLIVVSLLKKVFSMTEIAKLIERMTDAFGTERACDAFAGELEGCLARFFNDEEEPVTIERGNGTDAMMRTAITALIAKYDVLSRLERQ